MVARAWKCVVGVLLLLPVSAVMAGTPVVVDREQCQQQIAVLTQQLAELQSVTAANPVMRRKTEGTIKLAQDTLFALQGTMLKAGTLDEAIARSRMPPPVPDRVVQRQVEVRTQPERPVERQVEVQVQRQQPYPDSRQDPRYVTVMPGPTPQAQVVVVQPQPAPPQVVVAPAAPVRHAIADATLYQVMEAIKQESFPDEKMRVLESVVASNYFTVAQLKQLVDLYTYSSNKVHVVELIAPRLLDKENSYMLYSSFTYSSDKEQVQRILAH